MSQLKVKYTHPDSYRLTKIAQGDWIDLAVDEDVHLERKGDEQLVELGVAIALPEGFEAIVAERSSTHKKMGVDLANGIGIIDNSYRGNDDIWKAVLVANRDNVTIKRGTRVLQFRIQPSQWTLGIDIEEVDDLGDANRGGFGSTGH